MSEGNNNIDKLFKDAFSGGQFPMDEAMWTDANAMLKANKPKPSYFGFVSATVAVISIIGATAFFFSGDHLNAKNNTYTEREESSQVTFLESSTEDITYNATAQIIQKDNSVSASPEKLVNNTTRKELETNSSSNGESNSSSSQNGNTLVTAGLLANKASSDSPKSTPINNAALNSTNSTTHSTSFNTEDRKNQSFKTINKSETNTNSFPHEEFIHLTPQTHVELMNEPFSGNDIRQKNNSPTVRFLPITLRLSAGYGLGKTINSPKQNSTEYTSNNTNIDLSVEYAITPNWGIQSGFTYNLINETQKYGGLSIEDNSYFDYQDNSYWNYFDTEVILEDKTWWLGDWWVYGTYTDTIIDSNYVTQVDSNLISNFDSTQTNLSENQKITQLEIPVLVTYSFVYKRWVFQVATGASFGMFLNSQGKMIRFTDEMVTGVNSSKDFFNTLQYNYLLSTEVGFGLNEHWRITARPQVKVNLNSMFNSESGSSQKYLFYGVNIGMAYSF